KLGSELSQRWMVPRWMPADSAAAITLWPKARSDSTACCWAVNRSPTDSRFAAGSITTMDGELPFELLIDGLQKKVSPHHMGERLTFFRLTRGGAGGYARADLCKFRATQRDGKTRPLTKQ